MEKHAPIILGICVILGSAPLLTQCTPTHAEASLTSLPESLTAGVHVASAQHSKTYYDLAKAAIADRDGEKVYFDQKLDYLSQALHQHSFEEGFRTQVAMLRTKANEYFAKHPNKAMKWIKFYGPVPEEKEELIDLATWMLIAARVHKLSEAELEQEMLPEHFQ